MRRAGISIAVMMVVGGAAPARDHYPERSPHAEHQRDHASHPITAEHLRLYREVDLLAAAMRALEQRHFAEARALIARHRTEYAGKRLTDDQGLERLADCLQHPSRASRARAQRFYDEQTQSSVRRRLRRLCLEPAQR